MPSSVPGRQKVPGVALEKEGSPMRSSYIIPIGEGGTVATFTKYGVTP